MGWRTEGARKRSREHVWPQGQPVWEAVGPTAKGALCSRGPHVPPMGRWCVTFWFARKISLFPPFKLISFPPHFQEFWRTLWKFAAEFYNFSFLVLIISISYELEINRFKNQNCWSRRELQTQAFPETADFTIFLSWSIFSPWSMLLVQLLLFQFHLWSSLDSYYLIDEICWEVC